MGLARVKIGRVKFGDGSVVHIEGIGSITIKCNMREE